MAKNTEIEIQVKVEKLSPLLNFLKAKGKLIGTTRQVDEYFTPAHRNFIKSRPTDEWLRLRTAGKKSSINYKNWHHDKKTGKTDACDEYESQVDDVGTMRKLFIAINMKSIGLVDKKRQIWLYKDFEVAIDQVKNLGNFVEVEYKGKSKLPARKITSQMVQFLKDAGCGKVMRNYQGYPFMILFPKEVKFEQV